MKFSLDKVKNRGWLFRAIVIGVFLCGALFACYALFYKGVTPWQAVKLAFPGWLMIGGALVGVTVWQGDDPKPPSSP